MTAKTYQILPLSTLSLSDRMSLIRVCRRLLNKFKNHMRVRKSVNCLLSINQAITHGKHCKLSMESFPLDKIIDSICVFKQSKTPLS